LLPCTRYQILRLKCSKFDFGWGSAPDPAGGAYRNPPDPLAGFNRAYFEGQGREGKEEGRGRGEMGRGLIRASTRSPYFFADPMISPR